MDQRAKPFIKWHQAFLAAYAEVGNVTEAAKLAGVHRATVWRAKTTNPAFACKWAEAEQQAADKLEQEAWRRATEGTDEPVFYKGEKCGTIKRFSDQLLMFLLKGVRPEKYRERFVLPPGELDRAIEHELKLIREQSSQPLDDAPEIDETIN